MRRECLCTLCNEGRFPESELEVSVFELCHKDDPVPSKEFFDDQFQIIMIMIEVDKLLKK